jgi:hypothetical protein
MTAGAYIPPDIPAKPGNITILVPQSAGKGSDFPSQVSAFSLST